MDNITPDLPSHWHLSEEEARAPMPPLKNKMENEIIYVGKGFRIVRWRGYQGDYYKFRYDEHTLPEEVDFSLLMTEGELRSFNDQNPAWRGLMTPQHPIGTRANPPGVTTVVVASHYAERFCVVKEDRDSPLRKEVFYVLGEAKIVEVPVGGILLLGAGTVDLDGKRYDKTTVFEADPNPIKAMVTGWAIAAWWAQ